MKSEELGKLLLANPGLDVMIHGGTTISGICSKGEEEVSVVARKTLVGGGGTEQLVLGVAGDEKEIEGDLLFTDHGLPNASTKPKPR